MNPQSDPKGPLTAAVPVQEAVAALPPGKEPTAKEPQPAPQPTPSKEIGGQKGPEPTRFGDWENKGRCTDF